MKILEAIVTGITQGAMIALVSLIGIFGDPRETTTTVTEIVTGIGP